LVERISQFSNRFANHPALLGGGSTNDGWREVARGQDYRPQEA